MDAMILAAGLSTRLRPLTDHTPKPLIPVGGVPMLERVARRLIAAGADRLIVNTSHLSEQVEAFLAARDGFGVEWRGGRGPRAAPGGGGGRPPGAPPLLQGPAPLPPHPPPPPPPPPPPACPGPP